VQDASVVLTFDDGPDPRFTPLVLDVLAAAGVRATFFCVGRRALASPDIVRRAAAEGHAIGSHTLTHADLSALGPRAALAEVRRGRAAVADALGAPVDRFRAPFGRLGPSGRLALLVAGLRHEGWDVDPADYRSDVSATTIAAAIRGAAPAAVVLLHDGVESPLDSACLDRTATVEALRLILA
jgi:peptidoglycan-N-acetylglucosamine deacetylase